MWIRGPAEKAGVKPGDLVLSLDGKPMENGRQLRVNLYSRAVGDAVSLDLIRAGTHHTISVPVEERDDDPGGSSKWRPRCVRSFRSPLGVGAIDVNDRVAKLLPDLREKTGAVIVAIAPDAPYSQQGKLKPGDVILGSTARQSPPLRICWS